MIITRRERRNFEEFLQNAKCSQEPHERTQEERELEMQHQRDQ